MSNLLITSSLVILIGILIFKKINKTLLDVNYL